MPMPSPEEWAAKKAPVNHLENAIKAEGFTGRKADYIRATAQHESGGDPNAKSNKGATGIMQIMEGTFKANADKGWDYNNPAHNTHAGVREAGKQYDAANGNVAAAGAGYVGGNGARVKYYKGQPVVDKKNGYNSFGYGQQIVDKMPKFKSPAEWALGTPAQQAATARVGKTISDTAGGVVDLGKAAVASALTPSSGDMRLPLEHLEKKILDERNPGAYQRYVDERNRYKNAEAVPYPKLVEAILPKFVSNLAKDIPEVGNKAMIAGGHELNKLGAGTQQIGYDLAGGLAGSYARETGGDAALQKVKDWYNQKTGNLAQDQKSRDELYREFDEQSGLPGFVGASLPYMLDSLVAGPLLAKGASRVVSIPGKVIEAGVEEGKGLFRKGVGAMAESSDPILSHAGRRITEETVKPMVDKALAKSRHISLMPPMTDAGSLLGSSALGALEGGAHYDNSAIGGAISSALGTKLGNKFGPWVENSKNFRAHDPYEQELLHWWETKHGAKPMPGLKWGNQESQQFEAGMSNSENFSNPIKIRQQENDLINNRAAYEAIGAPVPGKNQNYTLSPEQIVAHKGKLQTDYENIEKNTTGVFKGTDANELNAINNQHTATAIATNIKNDKKVAKVVDDFHNQFKALMVPKRSVLGVPLPLTLTGEDFQLLRRKLKTEIDEAYSASVKNQPYAVQKAEALKPMLKILDGAIENGIRKGNMDGDAAVSVWKDLNEKYALTKMVHEHGTDIMGKFDPVKWGNYRMATDSERVITEGGRFASGKAGSGVPLRNNLPTGLTPDKPIPRLVELDRLAKIEYMRTHQAGSALAGMGLHPAEMDVKESLMAKLLKPKDLGGLSGPKNAALRAYLKGWPAHTGLLNWSGQGFGKLSNYTRAASVEKNAWPKTSQGVEDAYTGIHDKVRNIGKAYVDPWLEPTYSGFVDAMNKKN
jgi:hypothetical protein